MMTIDHFFRPGYTYDYNALARQRDEKFVLDALYEEGVDTDLYPDMPDWIDTAIDAVGADSRPSTVATYIIDTFIPETHREVRS